MRLTFDVLGDAEAPLLEASFSKVKVFKTLLDLNRDKVLCSNGSILKWFFLKFLEFSKDFVKVEVVDEGFYGVS